MDYNSYDDVLWQYKVKKYKPPIQEPIIDVEEKQHDGKTDISEDTLLVAKQFMVFAHLRCPKPPVRVARGLLQSTIRVEPTYYLGMNAVNVLVGNEQAFYMPFTNEEWHSEKAYPMSKESYIESQHVNLKKSYEVNKEMYGYKGNFKDFKKKMFESLHTKYGGSLVRKNPNEHWWDKAVQDVVNLCQERGVMMNG